MGLSEPPLRQIRQTSTTKACHAAAALLVAVGSYSLSSTEPRAQAAKPSFEFVEAFPGTPSGPQPWSSPRWDVIVHDRTDGARNEMQADHDDSCGPAPGTHHVSGHAEAVYHCNNHIMTALSSSDPGYAVIYLTPAAVVDWSAGAATIEFDLSTARSTSRDWVDVWLTPFAEAMVLPSEPYTPDLNGPPNRALHFRLGNKFAWAIARHPGAAKLSRFDWRDLPVPYSRRQRDRFSISVGNGELSLTYTNIATGQRFVAERLRLPSDLGFSQAIVQFGHHSYTPLKDCSFMTIGQCGPNTWHWGNVRLSPAQPFTMHKLGRLTGPGTLPVTPGSLRFAARGPTEIDWGQGFVAVSPVNGVPQNEGHFASYMVPVPATATQVSMRGRSTWAGAWRAENIAVWSLDTRPNEPAVIRSGSDPRHPAGHR